MNVLAINVSSLGDLISSLPVIEGLKRRHSKVDLICTEAFKGLVQDEDSVRLIDWPEAEAGRYDVIVDLTSSGFTRRKVARLQGAKKIGRADGWIKRVKARAVYDEIVPKDPFHNLVRNFHPLAEKLELKIPDFPVLMPPQNVELPPVAREFLEKPGLKVSFHPFSKDMLRTLPAALAADVVQILQEAGASIFLIGSPEEIPPDNRLPYAALTLRQLKAVLAGSDFFIGGDSGPLHLAAALRVPSLGLFGPTLPSLSLPLAPWARALDKDFSCRPCNTQKPCRFKHRCLKQLTREEVARAFSELRRDFPSGQVSVIPRS